MQIMGWADLGNYEAQVGLTPNIDRLAREGVSSQAAYQSPPLDLPQRADYIMALLCRVG